MFPLINISVVKAVAGLTNIIPSTGINLGNPPDWEYTVKLSPIANKLVPNLNLKLSKTAPTIPLVSSVVSKTSSPTETVVTKFCPLSYTSLAGVSIVKLSLNKVGPFLY